MDWWTIAAWMLPAHLIGSAVAIAIVSINRGERHEGDAPAARRAAASLERWGDGAQAPRR